MTTLVPLKMFLKENEITKGTTLVMVVASWMPEVGTLEEITETGEYKLKLLKFSPVFGTSPIVHVDYLYVPVEIQKFHILSPDDIAIQDIMGKLKF